MGWRVEGGMFRTGSGRGHHADGFVRGFPSRHQRNSSGARSVSRTIQTRMIVAPTKLTSQPRASERSTPRTKRLLNIFKEVNPRPPNGTSVQRQSFRSSHRPLEMSHGHQELPTLFENRT